MGEHLRAIFIPIFCAIVWLGVALLVAHPAEVFAKDWGALSTAFIDSGRFSRVFFPFLIAVDFVIALSVGHYRTSQSRFMIIVVAMVVYVFIASLPEFTATMQTASVADIPGAEQTTADQVNPPVATLIFLLICLLVVRSVSYYNENRERRKGLNFVKIGQ